MDVSALLQKEPKGRMQRTSGNTWKVLTLVVLPCPSLPFQELPKEPSHDAAEGLSTAPGSARTEPVVSLRCPGLFLSFYMGCCNQVALKKM